MFMVHGIGTACDIRLRGIVQCGEPLLSKTEYMHLFSMVDCFANVEQAMFMACNTLLYHFL